MPANNLENKDTPITPQANKKLMMRFAIGLFLIALAILGYNWLRGLGSDPDIVRGGADTAGMIAAIQLLPEGARAVVFTADGEMLESPGYREGAYDQDIAWKGDGNRVFFSSDREENVFHIYRWHPGRNIVERRTFGSRSQFLPWFPAEGETGLIIAGGNVLEFDHRADGITQQVLPPAQRGLVASPEGGQVGLFEGVYKQWGTSFKAAKWVRNRDWIAGVIQGDDGQTLIIQNLSASADPQKRENMPIPIAAGNRIEFDAHPASGKLVFSVQGFRFPAGTPVPEEFIQDGRIVYPFRHLLGIIEIGSDGPSQMMPIALSQQPDMAFSSPVLAPDGASLLMIAGALDDDSFRAQELVSMPAREGGAQAASRIVQAEVRQPSWDPTGRRITYLRTDGNGRQAIWVINSDGTGERNISGDRGDFGSPRFSPQAARS
jgi:hypothetical protein